MTVRPRTFLAGLALVLLVGLLIVLYPILSDPDHLKNLILQQIEAGIGRKLEVGQARLEFFPRPHLELSEVVIRDTGTSQEFLNARRFDIILRSTPLLRMQVVVKSMLLERPRITIRRNQAGQWNFLAPGQGQAGGDAALGNPLGLIMLIQEMTLTEGVVTVIDEFRPDGVRTVELTDLDVSVMTQPQGPPIDIRIAGNIPLGLNTAALSLTGTVTHAATAISQPGIEQAPPLQFQGTIGLTKVDVRHAMDLFGSRPVPDHVFGMANLKSRIGLVPGMSGYDMVFSDMQADVENLSIAGQASLSGITTAQPTFSLTVSSTPVSLDDLVSRFPTGWLPTHLQDVLAERKVKGIVEIVSATVTGATAPSPRASVTGEFRIRQGQALLGRDKVLAKDLAGTILLDPDRVRAADITGQYGPLHVSTGKVTVALLEQGPSIDLEVSGVMAAADLVNTLAENITSPSIAKPLARLRKVQGRTNVSFRLTGMMNQDDGLTFAGGEISPQNVSFETPALKDTVAGLSGRLVYSPVALELDRIGGTLGQGQFQLHGRIVTEGPARFQGFNVWMRAPAAQVLSLASFKATALTAVQGPVGVGLSLTGPIETPQMKGLIGFNDATLTVPDWLHKPAGQPAALEFDATLSKGSTLTVPRLEFIMPPARLSGKGKIRFGRVVQASSSLVSGPIPLNGLPAGMVLGGFSSGTLELSLDVKGRGTRWKNWTVTGWVALTDGQIASKAIDHPVTDIYLRLHLLRTRADVKRLEFRVNDSFMRVAGRIRDWRNQPVITATVESPYLDLELLIPKGERSPARDFLEDLAATSRVTATVDITRGRYQQLSVSELSARVVIGDETLEASRISGQVEEGSLSESRLVVRLPKRKPAEGEVSIRLSGFPTEKLMPLMGDDQRLITGELSLSGTVQGNGRHPRGITNTLNGNMEFRIDQGRIEKGTIVPKVLMILDIPSRLQGKVDLNREGMPFEKLTGTVTIQNGILTTKNLLIDSPVIKISGAGSYDMPTDQLDMALVVSPFGSYTKLLQGIPLFGKLLAGERKGFTTAFFDVKGSLQDPQIVNRPLKSVGAGIGGLAELAFDVLRNTLMLPAEIFSSGDEKAREAKPAPGAAPTPPVAP